MNTGGSEELQGRLLKRAASVDPIPHKWYHVLRLVALHRPACLDSLCQTHCRQRVARQPLHFTPVQPNWVEKYLWTWSPQSSVPTIPSCSRIQERLWSDAAGYCHNLRGQYRDWHPSNPVWVLSHWLMNVCDHWRCLDPPDSLIVDSGRWFAFQVQ